MIVPLSVVPIIAAVIATIIPGIVASVIVWVIIVIVRSLIIHKSSICLFVQYPYYM